MERFGEGGAGLQGDVVHLAKSIRATAFSWNFSERKGFK